MSKIKNKNENELINKRIRFCLKTKLCFIYPYKNDKENSSNNRGHRRNIDLQHFINHIRVYEKTHALDDLLHSITSKTITGLDCTYGYHGGCPMKSRKCLPFANT